MSPHPKKNLAILLTYCGALPFVLAVFAVAFDFHAVAATFAVRAYGAVIVSFIAGIHWGLYLSCFEKCHSNLFIASNVVALTSWLALMLDSPKFGLLFIILCLVCLLFLDRHLNKAEVHPVWFYRLRLRVTVIVLLSLSALVSLI